MHAIRSKGRIKILPLFFKYLQIVIDTHFFDVLRDFLTSNLIFIKESFYDEINLTMSREIRNEVCGRLVRNKI